MAVRSSTRWFEVKNSHRFFTPIPYVEVSGKFSSKTLGFWTAYPEQIICSLASTVFFRIRKIVGKRHSLQYARRCSETIFKAAAMYAVIHDDSMLDRFLGIFKRRSRRDAHNFLCWYLSNQDEDNRFVISQICSQISWLTFHSRYVRDVPRKCDKSFYDDFSTALSERTVGWGSLDRLKLKVASQAWKDNRSLRGRSSTDLASLGDESVFDDFVSENSYE